jgi:serine/threonine protein kinase
MGTVYQATDLLIGRSVALKVVHVRDGSNTSAILREARAMAAARHEHLAQIHAVELHSDTPVLVVEWMPRGTLDTLLASGVLSWRRALTLGAGIADALSHLHGIGVLHRDVKPSNIGLTSEGHSKLLDFGLAAAVDSGITVEPNLYESVGIEGSAATASVWLAGTPLYLSPELLEGGGAGPAQDTWALSLVLYESIAGCNPFRGQTLRTTVDNIRRCVLPDIRHYAPNAPPAVAAFLRCTLTRRSDRLRDASEIRSHIEQLLSVVKETV